MRGGRTSMQLDYTGNKHHALYLAQQIQRFWVEKGHVHVRVWVEPIAGFSQPYWAIRSNIQIKPFNEV